MALDPVLLCGATLIAMCVASFANVVVYRLPKRIAESEANVIAEVLGKELPHKSLTNLLTPSRCPSCNEKVPFYFNIPVLGWVLTGGRCSHCKTRVSIEYPLVELAGGLLGFWCFYSITDVVSATYTFFCCISLLTAMLIDLKTYLLPSAITRTLQLVALGYVAYAQLDVANYIAGFVIGLAGMATIGFVASLVSGRTALGWGDVELFGAVGAMVGVSLLPVVLLVSAITQLILMPFKKDEEGYVPFGPGIAIGAIVCLLWPELTAEISSTIFGF